MIYECMNLLVSIILHTLLLITICLDNMMCKMTNDVIHWIDELITMKSESMLCMTMS